MIIAKLDNKTLSTGMSETEVKSEVVRNFIMYS